MGVEFAGVLNPKFVNYESEKNWAPFVEPESWSCGFFEVYRFIKEDEENIIWKFSSMWQAVSSSENFEIDPSIAGVFSEFIFINVPHPE